MSVTYIEHAATRCAEVVIDGRIGKADIDRILPQMQAFMDAFGPITVLQLIRGLGFVNLPAALPYAGVGIGSLTKVKRVALVTDVGWLTGVARASALMSPIETQVFPLLREAEARAWLDDWHEGRPPGG